MKSFHADDNGFYYVHLCTGYQLKDICLCIQWLVPFHEVVKDRKVSSIKQFDKVIYFLLYQGNH